ncbi:MAG: chorismate synthase [Simkania sp.]|nr:chorismate synthase [Simkania sp.]
MASNSFGNLFKITTWGESHGPAIGVVIDGCPAGVNISEEEIMQDLVRRRSGLSPYTSPRKESDQVTILSGVFENITTGAPISLLISNETADPSQYTTLKSLLRPGHANFTYLTKYGIFDYRGGGRASARETAARVAAGVIAKKLLSEEGITLYAYLKQVGHIQAQTVLLKEIHNNPLFCPDPKAAYEMMSLIDAVRNDGDSIGGVVELSSSPLPVGLGDPIYEKLEANLAKAMLSLPASKGIEFGEGFASATMRGSQHNDLFETDENGSITLKSNHAGGTLGGISCGQPLLLRVAFKPPSSIRKNQSTLNLNKKETILTLPQGARHDPCVAIRAVPVVEAMAALVLADALLMHRLSRLHQSPAAPEKTLHD